MNLNPIDILVIIAYMGCLSLIGIYFSRRQKSRDEYFLGDRKVFWFLAGGSVLAHDPVPPSAISRSLEK